MEKTDLTYGRGNTEDHEKEHFTHKVGWEHFPVNVSDRNTNPSKEIKYA